MYTDMIGVRMMSKSQTSKKAKVIKERWIETRAMAIFKDQHS